MITCFVVNLIAMCCLPLFLLHEFDADQAGTISVLALMVFAVAIPVGLFRGKHGNMLMYYLFPLVQVLMWCSVLGTLPIARIIDKTIGNGRKLMATNE